MANQDIVVVPLAKMKIIVLVMGALVFVAGGLWLASLDTDSIQSSRRMYSPLVVHAVGYSGVAFFGLCGIFLVKKLFDAKPGLVISKEGITDNSSAVAAGLIPWGEITGIGEFQVQHTKMLIIHVREPEKYIFRGGAMKRALNRANMRRAGSPIFITSTALGISYPELVALIENSFKQYGQGA